MIGTARTILRLFDRSDDLRLALIFALTFTGAVVEALGVALIPGFVALLTSPDRVIEVMEARGLGGALTAGGTSEVVLKASTLLAAFFVLKNAFLITVVYLQSRFMADQQARLSTTLLAAYLRKPFEFHLGRNTAQLLRTVDTEVSHVFIGVLAPAFLLVSELMVVMMIGVLLIVFSPATSLLALLIVGGTTLAIYFFLRSYLTRLGSDQQFHGREMLKWINQSLGGIKETKVLGREEFFVSAYRGHIAPFVRATRLFQTVGQTPRFLIETMAIAGMLLAVIGLVLSGRDPGSVLPSLALFAVAAVRLMPSMSRILSSAHSIRYYRPAVLAVSADLEDATRVQPSHPPATVTCEPLPFTEALRLRNVSFAYPGAGKEALTDISVDIPRGLAVGLVGESGAGKTTFVDIILGLLKPERGSVLVDGVDIWQVMPQWRQMLGYIPQNIYLSDDTIRRNVAFGIPDADISDEMVWRALENAQLAEVIRAIPEGLDAFVGERGVRLSGGQRQRIGIARAIYHDPEILVMDEATSALDTRTERDLMEVLEALRGDRTLIVIAHRLSTIHDCDLLLYFSAGRLAATGTYDSLLRLNPGFRQMVG